MAIILSRTGLMYCDIMVIRRAQFSLKPEHRPFYTPHGMIGKQDKITNGSLISQVFPAHKQTLTNRIVGSDKFLTADMSKCMF